MSRADYIRHLLTSTDGFHFAGGGPTRRALLAGLGALGIGSATPKAVKESVSEAVNAVSVPGSEIHNLYKELFRPFRESSTASFSDDLNDLISRVEFDWGVKANAYDLLRNHDPVEASRKDVNHIYHDVARRLDKRFPGVTFNIDDALENTHLPLGHWYMKFSDPGWEKSLIDKFGPQWHRYPDDVARWFSPEAQEDELPPLIDAISRGHPYKKME